MFDTNTDTTDLLRAERYLTADAPPPTLIDRDAERHAIQDAVRPLTKRKTPENLFVYGPPGSGKTACVDHVFDALDREGGVKTVQINCWRYRTRPALLTELLLQLGFPVPRKGYPVDELLGKLREWLDKNRCVAVALDEFDQFEDKTEIVYDFHLLAHQAAHPLGVVLLSNLPPDAVDLDDRSWSRLHCRTVEFEPYTAEKLQAILENRVEQAFHPGVVQSAVIETIADEVAAAGGDCRDAFERLLQAGRRATREGVREVTPQYLGAGEGDAASTG